VGTNIDCVGIVIIQWEREMIHSLDDGAVLPHLCVKSFLGTLLFHIRWRRAVLPHLCVESYLGTLLFHILHSLSTVL
jgi:hypothetical protein